MASGSIPAYVMVENFRYYVEIVGFAGTVSTSVDISSLPVSKFMLLALLLYDSNDQLVGSIVAPPLYFRNLTAKVYGESSSQWGSMNIASDYNSATFNRTSANTSKVRLVGIGYKLMT